MALRNGLREAVADGKVLLVDRLPVVASEAVPRFELEVQYSPSGTGEGE